MRLYLVRHGETAWSKSGQHTGRSDIPLNPTGEQQARALGPRLASVSFTRVLTSPLSRAFRTAELANLGPLEVRDDLMEMDYGAYDGKTSGEIEGIRPGWELFRDGTPGGETSEEVAARVERVLTELGITRIGEEPAPGDGAVALVSHGHLLRILAARYLGLPPTFAGQLALDASGVAILGEVHHGPAIERWNLSVEA